MNSENKSSGITLGKIIGTFLFLSTIIVCFLMFKVFQILTAEPSRPENSATAPNINNHSNVEVWSSDNKHINNTTSTQLPQTMPAPVQAPEEVTEEIFDEIASAEIPVPTKKTDKPKKQQTKSVQPKPEPDVGTPVNPTNLRADSETPIEPTNVKLRRHPQAETIQPKPAPKKSNSSGGIDNNLIIENLM